MRLIDADALKEKATLRHGYDFQGVFVKVQDIDKAPTIEAAPVVHGRWIHVPSSDMMTGKAYKCSECGKMRYGSYMPNYCQCCGARMDGDGKAPTTNHRVCKHCKTAVIGMEEYAECPECGHPFEEVST